MSDCADDADVQIEAHNRLRMRLVEFNARQAIPTSPVCYECGEGTSNGARWCSAACRDMFVKRDVRNGCEL